jgi:cytochrome bd ubiquinol oxidase subunit II
MTSADWLWLIMGAGIIVYVLTGGADFGGGVWDLLAYGERQNAQRQAIEQAIAPIWEANHVWLIFVIVLCFTAFSEAFYAVSIALHIPITCALLGIVLRGASFIFRTYGDRKHRILWERVFAWSSALTPLFLGMIVGALATGEIHLNNLQFFAGWTSVFAISVGIFALVLFALLAAVYLTNDTVGRLQEDFRKRAIGAEIIAGFVSLVVLWSAQKAPPIWNYLVASRGMLPLQATTATFAGIALWALIVKKFQLAKVCVITQVILIIVGFGSSMRGYIVYPDLTLQNAGVHADTGRLVLIAVMLGSVLLLPSLWYLFRIFKSRPIE